MSKKYISIRAALCEVDEAVNECIERLESANFSDVFSPPIARPLDVPESDRWMFWATSVEVMWDFWTTAKHSWACPPGLAPTPIIWDDAKSPPAHAFDFDNGYVNLTTGTLVNECVISGSNARPRTCASGESVLLSYPEFDKFRAKLGEWLADVVCEPRADGYRKDITDPDYIGYAEYIGENEPKKPTSIRAQRDGWLAYVSSFTPPAKPNKTERRRKYSELGLSQKAGDALHKELSPPEWQHRGRQIYNT